MYDDLVLTTASYYPEPERDFITRRLRDSCARFNIPFVPYWHEIDRINWFTMKIEGLLQWLKTRDEDIIIYSDASDSFVVRPPDTILSRFYDLDAPIVVSADKQLFPYNLGLNESRFHGGPFICAGQFMGYRTELIAALTILQAMDFIIEDQSRWNKAYADDLFPMHIDADCIIFRSSSMAGGDPCLLHFNGGKSPELIERMDLAYKETT